MIEMGITSAAARRISGRSSPIPIPSKWLRRWESPAVSGDGQGEERVQRFLYDAGRPAQHYHQQRPPGMIQKIICAHELGHAVLHSQMPGIESFHDFALFDDTSSTEYEANVFAAELLLKDEDVFELLNDDLSFFGG